MVIMRGAWPTCPAPIRIVPCTCARRQLALEVDA